MTRKSIGPLFKLTAGVVVVCAVAVVVNAIRLCFLAKETFAETRAAGIVELSAKRNQLDKDLAAIRGRLAAFPALILAEEEKVRQADKIIAQLKDLESTWDRLVGNPTQQKANAEQMARMQQIRSDARAKIGGLKDETKRTNWEKDGLEIERTGVVGQLNATEHRSWALIHYLELGWQGVRRWAIWALVMNAAIVALVVVRSRRVG